MALVCQFVDSISASPTIRLDLNLKTSAVSWTTLVTTDFGQPERRYAIASTLLVNGGFPAAAADALRTLRLRLQVQTATADDTATQVQKLIRELDRPTNYLKTQIGTTPVFFRTYRSAPTAWEIVTTGPLTNLAVDVLADPYASGIREDPVSLVTVSTDPAAGTNPCRVDVTGVKGDVETPAFIRWTGGALAVGREAVIAVRRRGTPSGAPFLFQAEAMTQGNDTTTQANDANFSGSGNNYSRCTFAGLASMASRLSIADLGTASVDLRGRYRVYLRYRKNTASDGIDLRVRWGDVAGDAIILNATYTTPNTTNTTTADLGQINIPAGMDPVFDPSGVELVVFDSYSLQLQAQRLSGSGTIDFDFLLLVPADDRFALIKWADSGGTFVLDSRDNSAHARLDTEEVITAGAPAIAGGLPMLTPNQTNRIYMLRETAAGSIYALTTMTNMSVSYWPRYLVATRPAAT